MEVLGHADEAVERVWPVGEPHQGHAHGGLVLLQLDQLEDLALDGVQQPHAARPLAGARLGRAEHRLGQVLRQERLKMRVILNFPPNLSYNIGRG